MYYTLLLKDNARQTSHQAKWSSIFILVIMTSMRFASIQSLCRDKKVVAFYRLVTDQWWATKCCSMIVLTRPLTKHKGLQVDDKMLLSNMLPCEYANFVSKYQCLLFQSIAFILNCHSLLTSKLLNAGLVGVKTEFMFSARNKFTNLRLTAPAINHKTALWRSVFLSSNLNYNWISLHNIDILYRF